MQVACALRFLHAGYLVHLDVKPANVLLHKALHQQLLSPIYLLFLYHQNVVAHFPLLACRARPCCRIWGYRRCVTSFRARAPAPALGALRAAPPPTWVLVQCD